MKRIIIAVAVHLALVGPVPVAGAGELPTLVRADEIIRGGHAGLAKAPGDTLLLMGPQGSGAPHVGDFEAGWNGWTSVDETEPEGAHWQVVDRAGAGDLVAWCGSTAFAACGDSTDAAGGYGNDWHDILVWSVDVARPDLPAQVHLGGELAHDTEPGYDYVRFGTRIEGQIGYLDVATWDGRGVVALNESFSVQPGEYPGGQRLEVVIRFTSDPAWSDEDCAYPTDGACTLDDLQVTVSQAGEPDLVSFTDFQGGDLGAWSVVLPGGVGDFARRWSGLEDIDPCATNYSWQVAFIDDGVVVPGTGGSECINWCYGPAGYIVNTTGGLAGPDQHLDVRVLSPVMSWPGPQYDGLLYEYDVFEHEDLSADSPGIFTSWDVRSADTDGSHGPAQVLDGQPWRNRNLVYYGDSYTRRSWAVGDLLAQGRDEVQVSLRCWELGWAWGWTGDDGTPAPYFDNVAVRAYRLQGPQISALERDLAQDAFPEIDRLDVLDPGELHVRFDAALDISPAGHLRNDPGDSIVVSVAAVRSGAVLAGVPTLHYAISPNPDFDPYRTVPLSGEVAGWPASGASGIPAPGKWAFDLPDTGTLFPGDVLHYYIRAADDVAGDVRYATLPADLSGFGDFSGPFAWDVRFTVSALPSFILVDKTMPGPATPPVLLWDDGFDTAALQMWVDGLQRYGMFWHQDYDIYRTNRGTASVGNGLGGRTAGPALDVYSGILYTSGAQGQGTLGNGDLGQAPADDLGALQTWLDAGDRALLLAGDGLASDLEMAGGASAQFLAGIMGVSVLTDEIRPFVNNQSAPLCLAVPGAGLGSRLESWLANGGCPVPRRFDAVNPTGAGVRLAEFADPGRQGGAYPYSAATGCASGADDLTVSLPFALESVLADPQNVPFSRSARELLLHDLLDYLGYWESICCDVPDQAVFAVSAAPNPFNPAVRISYTVGAPGRLRLRVYDVRGRLVRELLDEPVAAAGSVTWNGTDSAGRDVSSGVYFTEARLNGEVRIGKVALLR